MIHALVIVLDIIGIAAIVGVLALAVAAVLTALSARREGHR